MKVYSMAYESYKFPVENEGSYKGRITFEARQEDYKTVQTAATRFVENIPTTVGNITGVDNSNESSRAVTQSAAAAQLDNGLDAFGGAGPNITSSQSSSPQQERLETFKGNSPATKTYSTPKPTITKIGAVSLYLPQTLQFSDAVEYTNIDLGILGTAALSGIQSGKSAGELASDLGGKLFPDGQALADAFVNGFQGEAAQVAGLRVARRLSSEVQGAISIATGVALNPNTRSRLRGPGIREFRFTFQMAPTSPAEAVQIQQIVKFFRSNMYPEVADLNIALKYPPKWNIRMSYDNRAVATGILPSFLKGVDVTYNPNAMAFHNDALAGPQFQQTDMTLTFVEERALSKTDVKNNNY